MTKEKNKIKSSAKPLRYKSAAHSLQNDLSHGAIGARHRNTHITASEALKIRTGLDKPRFFKLPMLEEFFFDDRI